jgi:CBS domain-containing protein
MSDQELLVSHLMTKDPATIRVDQPLSRAREILFEHRIHHVPVVDAEGKLAGILTTNDLMRTASFGHFKENASTADVILDSRETTEVMTAEVVSVTPTTRIKDAAELLSSGSFHALPVVDDDERLVGILTSTDLLRLLLDRL